MRCRGCGKEILWRETPSGALMPLDPEQSSGTGHGQYILEGETNCRPYEPLFDPSETPRHMNHWATCPKAEEFRSPPQRAGE